MWVASQLFLPDPGIFEVKVLSEFFANFLSAQQHINEERCYPVLLLRDLNVFRVLRSM